MSSMFRKRVKKCPEPYRRFPTFSSNLGGRNLINFVLENSSGKQEYSIQRATTLLVPYRNNVQAIAHRSIIPFLLLLLAQDRELPKIRCSLLVSALARNNPFLLIKAYYTIYFSGLCAFKARDGTPIRYIASKLLRLQYRLS